MFKDIAAIAEQIGWPLALGLAFLLIAERTGILSIKIRGREKSLDPHERNSERLDHHEDDIKELSIKVAKLEAIQDERGK